MNSLTFGKRIALGFTAIITVTLVLGLVAFSLFRGIASKAEYVATDPMPGTIAIIRMTSAVKDNFGLVQRHFNATEKEAVAAAIEKNSELTDKLAKEYEITVTDPEDKALFATFKEDRAAYVGEFKNVLALNAQGKTA